jgi:hypothetical protein
MGSNCQKCGGHREELQLACERKAIYTEVLNSLKAFLEESAAKGKKTSTITAPLSIEEFHEKRRQMRKPTNNNERKSQESYNVNNIQLQLKPQVPTQIVFTPLVSIATKWMTPLSISNIKHHQAGQAGWIEITDVQPSSLTLRAITSHASPSIQNPRSL